MTIVPKNLPELCMLLSCWLFNFRRLHVPSKLTHQTAINPESHHLLSFVQIVILRIANADRNGIVVPSRRGVDVVLGRRAGADARNHGRDEMRPGRHVERLLDIDREGLGGGASDGLGVGVVVAETYFGGFGSQNRFDTNLGRL